MAHALQFHHILIVFMAMLHSYAHLRSSVTKNWLILVQIAILCATKTAHDSSSVLNKILIQKRRENVVFVDCLFGDFPKSFIWVHCLLCTILVKQSKIQNQTQDLHREWNRPTKKPNTNKTNRLTRRILHSMLSKKLPASHSVYRRNIYISIGYCNLLSWWCFTAGNNIASAGGISK